MLLKSKNKNKNSKEISITVISNFIKIFLKLVTSIRVLTLLIGNSAGKTKYAFSQRRLKQYVQPHLPLISLYSEIH